MVNKCEKSVYKNNKQLMHENFDSPSMVTADGADPSSQIQPSLADRISVDPQTEINGNVFQAHFN